MYVPIDSEMRGSDTSRLMVMPMTKFVMVERSTGLQYCNALVAKDTDLSRLIKACTYRDDNQKLCQLEVQFWLIWFFVSAR
jgi:hypothetical protein